MSEIIAPYNLHTRNTDYIYSPPQSVHLFHNGEFVGPFVYGRSYELDMEILRRNYPEDKTRVLPLRFFCSGDKYKFWGLFEGQLFLLSGYLIDTAVLPAICLFAYRVTQASKMVSQYPWVYERNGLLGWRKKGMG